MSNFPESFIRFGSIYQTRVWGGRMLESRFRRRLPEPGTPFGEAWEISARPEADSVAVSGSLRGKTLTAIWEDTHLRSSIFGERAPAGNRFPLLCKILDAKDRLSIQVHPPAAVAADLGGEAKTEVWYIAHAEPGAKLYVGVRAGVSEADLRRALADGSAEECVHAIPVKTGEHIFIPSGRLHAIGAGLVIYEIQQNSDTTYRVYDWNRLGLDGKPRALHIEESLRCIDFSDVEPRMDEARGNTIAECDYFRLERHELDPGAALAGPMDGRFAVVTVVAGSLSDGDESFREGDFFLVPDGAETTLRADAECVVLLTTWPD